MQNKTLIINKPHFIGNGAIFIVNRKDKSDGLLAKPQINKVNLFCQVLNHAAYHNSPDHSTKGTISHIDVLYVLVSTEFQVLFTPLPGFFSPFLHSTIRYRSLSSI